MSGSQSEVAEPTSAEIAEHIADEIERLEKGIERYREGVRSTNYEYAQGSRGFLKRYLRNVAVYRLAQSALAVKAAAKAPG
jgi:hypothetical protein